MSNEKPKDINRYKKWLYEKHRVEITERTANYYQSVITKIAEAFEESDFWAQVKGNIREFDSRYRLKTGYPLWVFETIPELYRKPYDSFLLKTFRRNVLENRNWPNEPSGGWILPENWFSRVNDIIRTSFVVKYLDGVDFAIGNLQSLCTNCNLSSNAYFEAREEGYYAAHFYMKQDFEIPQITWDTKIVTVSVEIQVTTQLQEVIRQLTRKYYEVRRQRIGKPDTKWQWNYNSDEFVANYLGHILHYLEGMIMEIREKQKEK